MGFISVLVAALAGWITGAVWYSIFAKPWMQDSGVPVGEDGKPGNGRSPAPYILSLISMILVAGMMRHTFATTGIDTIGAGLVGGLGVGLFFIAPWLMMNYGYSMRPFRLTLIDGGYATVGCGVIGLVLMLF